MANYSVPAGTSAYSNTLTANAADTITFADRTAFATVTNLGSTGLIYVTGNGVVPTVPATGENGVIGIAPGQSAAIGNGDVFWSQAQRVIPLGVIEVGNGSVYNAVTNPSSPSNPGHVTYGRSLAGAVADDGMVVNIIGAAANAYSVAIAG